MSTSTFLTEMSARSRQRAARISHMRSDLLRRARITREHRGEHLLARALAAPQTNVIAEVKRKSPSFGLLRTDFDPARIAQQYDSAGAAAISVITEPAQFAGSLQDLVSVRRVTELPLLRKDFISDVSQVYEAAAAGADAILLIVGMLSEAELRALMQSANELGLDTLVEVHNAEELETALRAHAKIIGINNRDLHTLQVSIETSRQLAPQVPPDVILVSESGLKSAQHLRSLKLIGFRGFLIGEAFMASRDPGEALASLLFAASRVQTKICGITNAADALAAIEAGADLLGLNFFSDSERGIDVDAARGIVHEIAGRAETVGIFVDANAATVAAVARESRLSRVQLHGTAVLETMRALREFSPIVGYWAIGDTHAGNFCEAGITSILVDADTPRYGGSGCLADWGLARAVRSHVSELILAGGLCAQNVADAIRAVQPDVVDACSRLESSPGRKDARRMRSFVEAVRQAEISQKVAYA